LKQYPFKEMAAASLSIRSPSQIHTSIKESATSSSQAPFKKQRRKVVIPFAAAASIAAAELPYKKKKIPRALREALWLKHFGKQFEAKCSISWCANTITVYDFQAGHNVPECKGGTTTLDNLVPICSRCNLSMGSQYSIAQWEKLARQERPSQPSLLSRLSALYSRSLRFFQCWSSKSTVAPQPIKAISPCGPLA
jgi:hypothetical protein